MGEQHKTSRSVCIHLVCAAREMDAEEGVGLNNAIAIAAPVADAVGTAEAEADIQPSVESFVGI